MMQLRCGCCGVTDGLVTVLRAALGSAMLSLSVLLVADVTQFHADINRPGNTQRQPTAAAAAAALATVSHQNYNKFISNYAE